jgi:hypothetical protein
MERKHPWAELLEASSEFEIRPFPEGRRGAAEGKTVLLPSARMLNDAIRAIPEGQTVTPCELRIALARQHNASITCPVTTTMMLRVVAEAAHEAYQHGADLADVTPVWRVLDSDTPGGTQAVIRPYVPPPRARPGGSDVMMTGC